MRKILTIAFAAVALAFCACKEDKELAVKEGNIVGTWELYKEVFESGSSKIVNGEWGKDSGSRLIFEFRKGGTGTETSMEYFSGNWDIETYDFTYSLKNNKLTITDEDGDSETITVDELTSDRLVLLERIVDGNESASYRMYLKRTE